MRYYYTIIALLLCLQISAQTKLTIDQQKQIALKLSETSSQINSIKSSFTQEKHLTYLSTVIKSEGEFYFEKQDKLRWEYTTPYEYLIVASNGEFKIKSDGKISTYDTRSNVAFKKINDIFVQTVNGEIINSNDFEIEVVDLSKQYRVILKPIQKDMSKVLNTIELFFSKSDNSVDKIKMIESEQDYTIIYFNNKEINKPIQQSVFKL